MFANWETIVRAAYMCLAVMLALLLFWQIRKARAEDTSEPAPWRDGNYYRLSAEEKATVRRAVRSGDASSDPRLAEAAWRQAELARYGNPRQSRLFALNMALQGCVFGSLVPVFSWAPLWGALIPPVLLLPLGWLAVRRSERGREAADRAAAANRAVVEQTTFRAVDPAHRSRGRADRLLPEGGRSHDQDL